ncbi:MAG TPA: hypothetical protein VGO04_06435 [Ensifer sp.]|jgi:hypothetical protein|uniref:hypothetical protein n=1 Tax=Ensifer sp. TaxID=1872086 RepID=UPI002E0E5392|nr:hypothetical protein [Ensifer sp.]
MSGTVHEFPLRKVAEDGQQTEALALPTHLHAVDLILNVERIRVAADNLQHLLRLSPDCTAANQQMLGQILDGWVVADGANSALASILECKGQARWFSHQRRCASLTMTTDYSAESRAMEGLGQTLGNLIRNLQKQQKEAAER